MSDLIDRQDAIAKFKKTCTSESIDKNGIKRGEIHTAMTYEGIIKIIESLPSAEPERKTGKWEDSGWKIIYRCSECGNYLDFSGLNAGRGDANFCPNCGSEMSRGE